MDVSGKNRYELLFMDDEVSDPLDNVVKKKVKQAAPATAVAAAPAAATAAKSQSSADKQAQKKSAAGLHSGAEKENKSAAMNKNFERKSAQPAVAGNKQKFGGAASGGAVKDQSNYRGNRDQDQRPPREGRVNTYKQQNGETREQRNNRRNRDDRQPQNGTAAPGEFNNDQQRPQRTNRGPPRPRNFESRGKREFDRQSGSDKTGVKAVDKRDGAGAHNWGNVKQDIEDLNKSNDEDKTKSDPSSSAGLTDKEESGNDQSTEQQTTAAIEEETKELTLDEWKAQRQQRAKPQYNIRKAGEGEDQSQWKKMVALNNKKKVSVTNSDPQDGVESDDEFEYDPSMYPQRVGRLQRVLDIEFHFNDGRRAGGMGRGGRGGRGPRGERPPQEGGAVPRRGQGQEGGERPERGQRGTGRPRNENQRQRGDGERPARAQGGHGQHAPKVDDERQFPTLS